MAGQPACSSGGAACIAADLAAAFVEGRLAPHERAAVERRIAACAGCRAQVIEVGRKPARDAVLVDDQGEVIGALRPVRRGEGGLAPGEAVGRYVVERPLGEGGMGVVSLARDPELHRQVVIKLVRPDRAGEDSDDFEARLRREAQAMAQVSHSNVVQIFDIGRRGERVFLAMEFVDGHTLDEWLRAQPRTQDEILRVLGQAGAGLAAAHRAGLIDRDFKPSNVLVGRDGAVKVTDFGLARAAAGASGADDAESGARPGATRKLRAAPQPTPGSASRSAPRSAPRPSGVHAVLTEVNMVLGTPAYMAPEQAAGEAVDARSDQFALAVTLLDALLGQRASRRAVGPGDPAAAIAAALDRAGVAAPVAAAISRALARDPAARFPTTDDFLRALAPPAGRARSRGAAVMIGALLCAGAVAAWFTVGRAPSPSTVERAAVPDCASQVTARWAGAPRTRVVAALSTAPRPFAGWDAERIAAAVDQAVDALAADEMARCRAGSAAPHDGSTAPHAGSAAAHDGSAAAHTGSAAPHAGSAAAHAEAAAAHAGSAAAHAEAAPDDADCIARRGAAIDAAVTALSAPPLPADPWPLIRPIAVCDPAAVAGSDAHVGADGDADGTAASAGSGVRARSAVADSDAHVGAVGDAGGSVASAGSGARARSGAVGSDAHVGADGDAGGTVASAGAGARARSGAGASPDAAALRGELASATPVRARVIAEIAAAAARAANEPGPRTGASGPAGAAGDPFRAASLTALAADALEAAGTAALAGGDAAAADADFERMATAGERAGDDAVRGRALLHLIATAQWRGSFADARRDVDQLHAILARHRDAPRDALAVALVEASAFTDLGDVAAAFAAWDRARDAAAALADADAVLAAAIGRAGAMQALRFDLDGARAAVAAALTAAGAASPAARARGLVVSVDLALAAARIRGRGRSVTAAPASGGGAVGAPQADGARAAPVSGGGAVGAPPADGARAAPVSGGGAVGARPADGARGSPAAVGGGAVGARPADGARGAPAAVGGGAVGAPPVDGARGSPAAVGGGAVGAPPADGARGGQPAVPAAVGGGAVDAPRSTDDGAAVRAALEEAARLDPEQAASAVGRLRALRVQALLGDSDGALAGLAGVAAEPGLTGARIAAEPGLTGARIAAEPGLTGARIAAEPGLTGARIAAEPALVAARIAVARGEILLAAGRAAEAADALDRVAPPGRGRGGAVRAGGPAVLPIAERVALALAAYEAHLAANDDRNAVRPARLLEALHPRAPARARFELLDARFASSEQPVSRAYALDTALGLLRDAGAAAVAIAELRWQLAELCMPRTDCRGHAAAAREAFQAAGRTEDVAAIDRWLAGQAASPAGPPRDGATTPPRRELPGPQP